ncbi:N-acetylmuramoyl-L-alanine amidase [Kiloniella laminariae]|uniref:N-acetylmuramoyl-L-alanine amidase n=1 Tax=Kiloniella laminariae TaxID=454162 RepID=A0ABT4LDX9_9PROT|nr:N-acetylmuramoyl-L-alanine amidase [Kiloniella laminariae]MCZ4279305.1 N-acetylmuramoyl-L-alanine amidase [Kiloniella laminariae]
MQICSTVTSPNFGPRPEGQRPDMLLLHYTGMQSGAAALERLCDPAAQVSAHYLIEENGTIFQLVDETQRAWHAGLSCWGDNRDINSCSIGIEIVNPGHEWGYRAFPDAQMISVIQLCQNILARHAIPAERILGHSDVAPLRKEDPGELFDWARLAHAGVGLWPETTDITQDVTEQTFLEALQRYGYDVDLAGLEEEKNRAAIIAFQRHFRPAKFDGLIDRESCRILGSLLSRLDARS